MDDGNCRFEEQRKKSRRRRWNGCWIRGVYNTIFTGNELLDDLFGDRADDRRCGSGVAEYGVCARLQESKHHTTMEVAVNVRKEAAMVCRISVGQKGRHAVFTVDKVC